VKTKFIPLFLLAAPLWSADAPKKEPEVPAFAQFVRTLDVEGNYAFLGSDAIGSQGLRVETRYLDPDVNAFVGLIGTFSRFNEKLHIGESPDVKSALFIANWGINIGLVRGKHLWAIDLMGASLGNHLAFGPAIVGEHDLAKKWKLYHRTTIDFFTGDTIVDSDQGFLWNPWKTVGFTAGYRIFAAQHTSLNGPRLGLIWRFQSPKIPFIFPSLG
jgi:hypothetical protein